MGGKTVHKLQDSMFAPGSLLLVHLIMKALEL